ILLTGMGSDGAKGLLGMKQKGAWTIAQEESSCVVYGMPRVAVELGATSEILTPEQIIIRLQLLSSKNG
ncbi:MAG: chemotaxis protein CheB, partial [SAR324 cluster bacterium]|nr:chemotaxis protein CheB [SAR324 cluster bacterium]